MYADPETLKGQSISTYQPSTAVAELTSYDQADYQIGEEILNQRYEELNGYSVLDRNNKDQRTFNSFVDESVDDPNEAWKWRGTRSMARNRAMAMHANMTAEYIIPGIFAQNEGQQEDIDAAEVMSIINEWMINNSNYKPSFILTVMGMLVNTVTYLGAEYCTAYQTIRERTEEGYSVKQVIDEVLSGFQAPVYSADQVLITNAYEQNIQRQRKVIKQRWIEYSEAKAKWKDHQNFEYVKPGVQNIFNSQDGLFYATADTNGETSLRLVHEVTSLSRQDDHEVVYLNGVYMGSDDIEWNPIKHRDNRNAPKYNITPFGYERINEHFYFYKSMINRVGWDDQLNDAIYQQYMNRVILDSDPPTAYSGVDKVDTSVIFPGASIASANDNFKATPLIQPMNNSAPQALAIISNSMAEASVSDTTAGNLPNDPNQKATTVSIAAQNARIILNGVRKNLGESVSQYGELMNDIALQHLTVPQVDEITGGLSYRQFTLGGQMVNGKRMSKRVVFDDNLIGAQMSREGVKKYAIKMLEQINYPDNKESLYRVNPEIWSKLKYYVVNQPETLEPKNREFERIMAERMYRLLRSDPLIEPEALVRKLLHSYYRTGTEEMMAKNPQQIMGGQQTQQIQQGNPNEKLPALPSGILSGVS